MAIKIRKLSEHIGAEVEGVDTTSGIDESTFEQLGTAMCEHSVILFHDQELSDEQHIAFSAPLSKPNWCSCESTSLS